MNARRWIVLSVLCLAGCGGLVVFDRDGAGGAGSDDDDGVVAASASSGSGDASSGSGDASSGSGDASSGSGDASSGSGDASSGSGPDPVCPAVKPSGGEACDTPNQVCDYGGFCNSVICSDGFWALPVC